MNKSDLQLGLGNMEKKFTFPPISVDIDIYNHINQITISIKLKASFLLLSEM